MKYAGDQVINKTLNAIEVAGNKLPHPTMLFIYLCAMVIAVSWIASLFNLSAEHPITENSVTAKSLLTKEGLHWVLQNTVDNFIQFAPVGTVLVAIIGIGIAERSGLLATLLQASVVKAPAQLLSFIIVTAGVASSLAADTGYVVLIPLAALIFKSVGRHPLIGIAAAFAGVSGGYSANLLIGPLDAILGGISQEAARVIIADYEVNATANYYFILVSTFLIAAIGTWITEKVVAPRLPYDAKKEEEHIDLNENDRRGLRYVGWFTLGFILLISIGLAPTNGILRSLDGDILKSPFIAGIVTITAVYAGLCGIIYGRVVGKFKKNDDIIEAMESNMATMASYLVLMFFAAQFVNYFNWTHLGQIIAINGAEFIGYWQLSGTTLLITFIFVAALINLFIGSSSAKWALIAPVFVPMFLISGISPEATQVAYRIGDSSTNIITPLMPYFGVVVAFAQQHQKNLGMGTVIAMMLPYSIALLFGWIALLLLWITFDLPLGPSASIFISYE